MFLFFKILHTVVPLFIDIHINNFFFGVQSTMSEIQIDCLSRKLAEADLFWSEKSNDYSMCYANKGTINGDKNFSLRESEAILVIKRLQEQVYFIFIFFFLLTFYIPVLFNFIF